MNRKVIHRLALIDEAPLEICREVENRVEFCNGFHFSSDGVLPSIILVHFAKEVEVREKLEIQLCLAKMRK